MKRFLPTALASIALYASSPLLAHPGHHHHALEDHDSGSHDDHDHDHIVALTEDQIKEAKILTMPAKPGHLIQQIRAPGKVILSPESKAYVTPQVSGMVTKIYKQIGDDVRQDEVIAILESREIAEAKADYIAAARRAQLKQTLLSKEQTLRAQQISAEKDLWEAQAAAEEASINAELARQKLLALGFSVSEINGLADLNAQNIQNLRYYELRSPINGTLVATNLVLGEHVGTDHRAATVADLSQLLVEVDIPASQYKVIKKGLMAKASTGKNDQCSSEIVCFKPIVEDSTRTIKAYAKLKDENNNWTPGTYVNMLIDSQVTKQPLVIPLSAIQQIDGETVVFVAQADGFEIRPVTTGSRDNQRVAIIDGLQKGEQIAVTNTFLLKADHEKDEAEHEH